MGMSACMSGEVLGGLALGDPFSLRARCRRV